MENYPSLDDMINYLQKIVDNIDHWLLLVDTNTDDSVVREAVFDRSMLSAILEELYRLEGLEK